MKEYYILATSHDPLRSSGFLETFLEICWDNFEIIENKLKISVIKIDRRPLLRDERQVFYVVSVILRYKSVFLVDDISGYFIS